MDFALWLASALPNDNVIAKPGLTVIVDVASALSRRRRVIALLTAAVVAGHSKLMTLSIAGVSASLAA